MATLSDMLDQAIKGNIPNGDADCNKYLKEVLTIFSFYLKMLELGFINHMSHSPGFIRVEKSSEAAMTPGETDQASFLLPTPTAHGFTQQG